MRKGLVKKIEVLTNVAIIIVALVIGIILVKKFFFTDSSQITPKENIVAGSKINLSQIDWSENGNTLLLVLSTDCRFCTESVPFYKKLVQELQNSKVNLAAVFPQDASTSKNYLEQNQVIINDVYQTNPTEIGVHGTPTILLINDNGEVINTWFGKLVEDQEKQILEKIRLVSNAS